MLDRSGPFVSVLITNYNHANYLQARIDSVLNQDYTNFEVILLDDASSDFSKEIIDRYRNHPKVSHVYFNLKNSGSPFGLWKSGIDLAKGEYIWIAESDDLSDEKFLLELSKFMVEDNRIIFCRSIIIDALGQKIDFINFFEKEFPKKWQSSFNGSCYDEIQDCFVYANIIGNTSSVVFRKPFSFPNQILSMRFAGDWFFWVFLMSGGGKIQYVAKYLNFWRLHKNTTRKLFSSSIELIRFREYWKTIDFATLILQKLQIHKISKCKYDWIIEDVFNRAKKLGRFSIFALFPPLRGYMFLKYYWRLFVYSFKK